MRYLSHCMGSWLDFTCSRCGVRKRFDAERTLQQIGDINDAGLCTWLAESTGCKKAVSTSKLDVCKMRLDVTRKPTDDPWQNIARATALSRAGLRISRATRFDELQEWEMLYATCSCGRSVFVDKYPLIKKYGRLQLRELAAKLLCKHCGREGQRDFAIADIAR